MSSRTVSVSLPVPSRRGLTVALLGALAGAAIAVVAVLSLTGEKPAPKPQVFHGDGFAFATPRGWHGVPAAKRATFPGKPVAIVERTGRGVVVIKRTPPPADGSLKKLSTKLAADLKKRFPDFRFVSAKVQKLRGGNAFLFTFVRTKQGTAQSIAFVKVGAANYTLDTVTDADDQAAAAEAAAVVRSFGP